MDLWGFPQYYYSSSRIDRGEYHRNAGEGIPIAPDAASKTPQAYGSTVPYHRKMPAFPDHVLRREDVQYYSTDTLAFGGYHHDNFLSRDVKLH